MPEPRPSEDHDLLIELRTEMRGVRTDIQDMRTGVSARLLNLESNAISKIAFDEAHKDHELRLRVVEAANNQLFGKQSLIGGAIGVAAAIIAALIHAGTLF